MSLADELAAEKRKTRPGIVEAWLAEWYPTLTKTDQKTWDEAVANLRQPGSELHRLAQRHGYTASYCMFTRWLQKQRDTR